MWIHCWQEQGGCVGAVVCLCCLSVCLAAATGSSVPLSEAPEVRRISEPTRAICAGGMCDIYPSVCQGQRVPHKAPRRSTEEKNGTHVDQRAKTPCRRSVCVWCRWPPDRSATYDKEASLCACVSMKCVCVALSHLSTSYVCLSASHLHTCAQVVFDLMNAAMGTLVDVAQEKAARAQQ